MATASMKIHKKKSRRKIIAVNFLSNISLDGSHKDTKYAMFNRKHHRLKGDDCEESTLKNVNNLKSESSQRLDESVKDEESVLDGTCNKIPDQSEDTVQNISFQNDSFQDQPITESTSNTPNPPRSGQGPKRVLRSASYSGEREKSVRRKLMQITDNLIKDNLERSVERCSRRSSSLSNDSSNDSVTTKEGREIRFLSPDSKKLIRRGRLLIVSKRKVPFVVCSTLPFIRQHKVGRVEFPVEDLILRSRHSSGSKAPSDGLFSFGLHALSRVDDGQDISYSELLVPSTKRGMQKVVCERGTVSNDTGSSDDLEGQYDPSLLDDPELQSGSYRTLLTFPSYMTSIIDYVKPATLKKELNEQFREKFQNIQLTLTKLRSLKRELRHIAHVKCGLDIWVVAQAYVFFEKLILKLLINKHNRKLCAGACVILSAKLNDVKGAELTKLIQQTEDDFRLHRKELLNFEFACLVALRFSLHTSDQEIYPHFQRLLYQS